MPCLSISVLFYLFLVVEVHLAVSHLPPQPVHFMAELQLVLPLIGRLIKLFGQVEVLAIQLSILLTQLGKLLLQVSDHLREYKHKDISLAYRNEKVF